MQIYDILRTYKANELGYSRFPITTYIDYLSPNYSFSEFARVGNRIDIAHHNNEYWHYFFVGLKYGIENIDGFLEDFIKDCRNGGEFLEYLKDINDGNQTNDLVWNYITSLNINWLDLKYEPHSRVYIYKIGRFEIGHLTELLADRFHREGREQDLGNLLTIVFTRIRTDQQELMTALDLLNKLDKIGLSRHRKFILDFLNNAVNPCSHSSMIIGTVPGDDPINDENVFKRFHTVQNTTGIKARTNKLIRALAELAGIKKVRTLS